MRSAICFSSSAIVRFCHAVRASITVRPMLEQNFWTALVYSDPPALGLEDGVFAASADAGGGEGEATGGPGICKRGCWSWCRAQPARG